MIIDPTLIGTKVEFLKNDVKGVIVGVSPRFEFLIKTETKFIEAWSNDIVIADSGESNILQNRPECRYKNNNEEN